MTLKSLGAAAFSILALSALAGCVTAPTPQPAMVAAQPSPVVVEQAPSAPSVVVQPRAY